MADHLIDYGATIMCPHGVPAQFVPANVRVKAGGQYLATASDVCMIAGCPFTVPPGVPMPCLTVQFLTQATRVKVMGKPALLSSSQALCQGPGPPLPPNVVVTQMRVKGT